MSKSALSMKVFAGYLLLFFIAFVVAGLAPPVLILFGVIDLAGAAWTALALRGEAGHQAA